MHGKAKINFTDGTYFEGEYIEDVKCGYGKMIFGPDEKYEGEFYDDLYHGKGK